MQWLQGPGLKRQDMDCAVAAGASSKGTCVALRTTEERELPPHLRDGGCTRIEPLGSSLVGENSSEICS
jgi:hypothetical protein